MNPNFETNTNVVRLPESPVQDSIEQAVRGWLIKDISNNLKKFDLPTLYQLQFIATFAETEGGDLPALARYMQISLDRMGLWPETCDFVGNSNRGPKLNGKSSAV